MMSNAGTVETVEVVEEHGSLYLVLETTGNALPIRLRATEDGLAEVEDAIDTARASEGSDTEWWDVTPNGSIEVPDEADKPQPGDFINPADPHDW